MKKPMNPALCLFVVGLALTIASGMVLVALKINDQIPPFTVLCDGKGAYTFTSWRGAVEERTFASFEDATAAMLKHKAWSEEFDRSRVSGEWKAEEEARARRAASFKPCR